MVLYGFVGHHKRHDDHGCEREGGFGHEGVLLVSQVLPRTRLAGAHGPEQRASHQPRHQMGHHCARHLARECQAVHAPGCLSGTIQYNT